MRSAAAGVQVDSTEAPITLGADDLRDHRQAHPLAKVFPLLDDVLGQAARECGVVMAVADAEGQLLWVCGTPATLRRAETIGFVEGSNWDERFAGTNAPGTALTLDRAVSVVGSEHFRRSVRNWSCAATPIHDPQTQAILGVLDITGGEEIVVPQTMAMVRAAARMAEAELALSGIGRFAQPPASVRRGGLGCRLEVLGRDEALLTINDGRGRGRTIALSRRHSEILLLLAAAPQGLSGDELAGLIYEDDRTRSTLRAEVNRLRNLLGDDLLGSRPYRIVCDVSGDWSAVEAAAAAGAVADGLRAYRGPALPGSSAPGVVHLRERLIAAIRGAVVASGRADLMATWTRSSWGSDDYGMWRRQLVALPTASPLRPLVVAQLSRLDRELGVSPV